MSIFVVLGNWTAQGIKNVTNVPKRTKMVHDMVNKAGGKMQVFYTLGEFDFVAVIEIPKDEDLMAILLCIGSMGNVRTRTLKAWTEEEAIKVISTPHP